MALLIILPLTIILLTILYYYLTWPYDYWTKQGVQTAKHIIPGFGNGLKMVLFRENINFLSNKLYKRCPPDSSMIGMFLFRTPTLLIRDPKLVQTVLVKEFANFNNNLAYLDDHRDWFLSKNPFFTVGDNWRRYRKLIVDGMSQRKLKIMFKSMQRVSASFEEYFDRISNTEVELRDLCYKLICEILCQVGFGIKPDGNFLAIVTRLLEVTWFRAMRQLFNFFIRGLAKITGISFTPIELQRFFGDLAKGIADTHKLQMGTNHEDFVHMVMETSEDANEETVLSVLSSFFVDGFDTVAGVVSIALYRLAWNKKAQEKLQKEILDTLANCNGKLTYDIMKDMIYLDHVVNEVLRLNPILEISARICNETTTLQGSDGQTCTLQPGNIVIMPVQSIQTDEKYWVNGDEFNPDRFYSDDVPKFAFLPFGDGPRMCPGVRFGLLEIKVLLITVLKKFKVQITDKTPNTLQMDPRSYLPTIKERLIVKLEKI